MDLHALAESVAWRRGRFLLGVAGPPGSGKSTFAGQLAKVVNAEAGVAGQAAAVLAMDGFHLPAAELERRGLTDRKGSPGTFDGEAFVAMLRRLREGTAVRAPVYDRSLHDVVPAAQPIDAGVRLIIVEGNYLLLDELPWVGVRPLLDEVWYLDVDPQVCLERVRQRHLRGGRGEAEAARKIAHNDRPNAERVAATRERADRLLRER